MHRTGSVKALWACLGENTLTSKNYIDLRFIWVYRSMQKTKVISQAFLELLKFQESFNGLVWTDNKIGHALVYLTRTKQKNRSISWL